MLFVWISSIELFSSFRQSDCDDVSIIRLHSHETHSRWLTTDVVMVGRCPPRQCHTHCRTVFGTCEFLLKRVRNSSELLSDSSHQMLIIFGQIIVSIIIKKLKGSNGIEDWSVGHPPPPPPPPQWVVPNQCASCDWQYILNFLDVVLFSSRTLRVSSEWDPQSPWAIIDLYYHAYLKKMVVLSNDDTLIAANIFVFHFQSVGFLFQCVFHLYSHSVSFYYRTSEVSLIIMLANLPIPSFFPSPRHLWHYL